MHAEASGPWGRAESEQGYRRAGHVFAPCQKHASHLFFGWNAHRKRQELREGGDQVVEWLNRSGAEHPPTPRARAHPQLLSQAYTVGGW